MLRIQEKSLNFDLLSEEHKKIDPLKISTYKGYSFTFDGLNVVDLSSCTLKFKMVIDGDVFVDKNYKMKYKTETNLRLSGH